MLAKIADELPAQEGGYQFEPKWDGFRAIVFRGSGDEVTIQSRDLKPLDRYFPELHEALAKRLPPRSTLDGEIVVAGARGLDFDALQQRIHPAPSRIARLARETPASFVAFDLLVAGGKSIAALPQGERRQRLERLLGSVAAPVHLTPATTDRQVAAQWLKDFEGAGLDGVIAKPLAAPYQPGKRAMLKIKHQRSADCVVAGLRWHKAMRAGADDLVGSLLLGLYDAHDVLHHVGVTSSFTMAMRATLAHELEPLREGALAGHPWQASLGASSTAPEGEQRLPGATSRWSAGKDLAWVPLRLEKVCEVRYDHLQGDRFRHATTFLRWRTDKAPADCRYDQLEVVAPFELRRIFKG